MKCEYVTCGKKSIYKIVLIDYSLRFCKEHKDNFESYNKDPCLIGKI